MFNPIPQVFGFIVVITFMSLPAVAVSMTPTASAILLFIGRLLGTTMEEEDTFAEVRSRTS